MVDLKCEEIPHDAWNLWLGLFLLSGTIFSYLIQHYRIISTGSSLGFSPWFLLLGMLGGWANLVNIVILQFDTLACCSSLSIGRCLENSLGVIQVFAIWILFTIIFWLYLAYFPTGRSRGSGGGGIGTRAALAERLEKEWKEALIVSWASLFFHLGTLLLSALMIYAISSDNAWVLFWAGIMGLFGTLTGVVQYVPQLFNTWHSKRVGALSIFTMMIQAPGSFLLFISLAVRPGTNWTTWLPYFVTGSFQSALLGMCLVWRAREKHLGYASLPATSDGGGGDEEGRVVENGAMYWEDDRALMGGGAGSESDLDGERRFSSALTIDSIPGVGDETTHTHHLVNASQ